MDSLSATLAFLPQLIDLMMSNARNLAFAEASHNDAFTAAQQAAQEASDQLGTEASWALAFGGGRHDPVALLAGLRTVLGDIPVVGGSTAGLITANGTSLSGFECGLILFGPSLMPGAIVAETGLCDMRATGKRLGTALRDACPEATTILLLYDSLHTVSPRELHVASPLVDGLHDGLGDLEAAVIGAGTLGDLNMEISVVFDGQAPCQHTAVALVLPARLRSHIRITHGCYPASDFMTITRIEGARVLELDGRPALEVAAERLKIPLAEIAQLSPATLPLALGEKQGAPYAPFSDDAYNNRLVVGADAASGALILFEADFRVGTRVQLMDIDTDRMIDSAREQTERLLAELGDARLEFGLYIDCIGRAMAFNGLDEDESAPVRTLVGARCPLLGFFSGVEIAPIRDRCRPLDWTGVLAVFTTTPDDSPGEAC
ncbi:MAG: FIST C-terminal domain-containing protein [Lamprobacter sp.]|uniref:FIST signal transduction protein n=1 Tax=Lamprobacter sp. TaxID=3100796 RepID=UPI002B259EFC|nr:FIST N-terminal domain-containing protein [Lamprobacter sp.]MEA3641523.1 FIST C-terminal domain-containing protein [Lamprobacter sp.]